MSEILFRSVKKTYNPGLFRKKVHAIHNLDLEVSRGEVFGLVGPNGAGKSSTIRLLLGLSRVDEGSVLFRGRKPEQGLFQREIGYLPENPYLYDHLTLQELLEFGGRVSAMGAEDIRNRSEVLLESLGMAPFRKRRLRTFSKGMLQRAGICFALLHDPSVVVLDEPMSGLDPVGRKLVFDLISDLKKEGRTVFLCSHILSDVERLCDRVGILAKGRLVRTLGQEELEEDSGKPIHLVLGPVSDHQRESLSTAFPLAWGTAPQGDLVSVSIDDFPGLFKKLEELGISVLGTRSEKVSLEELFMQTVREVA